MRKRIYWKFALSPLGFWGTTCENIQCSEDICKSEQCDDANNYLCLAGSAINGCSADSQMWMNEFVCTSCCDIDTCKGNKIFPGYTF